MAGSLWIIAIACGPASREDRVLTFAVTAQVDLPDSVGFVRFVGPAKESSEAYVIASQDSGAVALVSFDGIRKRIVPSDSVLRPIAAGIASRGMWIADDAARRVLFATDGTESWRWVPVPSVKPRVQPRVVGVLATGAAFAEEWPQDFDSDSITRLVVRIDDDSASVVDSLLELGRPLYFESGTGSARLPQPWAYSDIAVVAVDQSSLVLVRQRPPVAGSVEVKVAVEELSDRGTAVNRPWTMRFPAVPITDAEVGRWLAPFLGDSNIVRILGGHAQARARLVGQLYRPTAVPPIRKVIATPDHGLLVELAATGDSLHRWELWTRRGREGRVSLPRTVDIQAFSDSAVWAVERSTSGRRERLLFGQLVAREP